MNFDVYVTFEDKIIPEILYKAELDGIFIHLYDECTRTGKKEAWALKSEWGAKQSPFALVCQDGKPVKAFYSEADNDVINTLIKFLHGN